MMVVKNLILLFTTIFIRFQNTKLSITNRNLNCNLNRGCFRKSRNRSW